MADPMANYERNKAYAKIGPYETALNPNQEKAFMTWVSKNKIPFDPTEEIQDYDMRGFYKDVLENRASTPKPGEHFPDTYKTPYHESFSNESRYANYDAPRWYVNPDDPDLYHLIDKEGTVVHAERLNRR
jgi:hypothetical protein